MKRFSKLALLLGFVSVVSVQGYSVKAAHAADFGVMDFRAGSSQVGATMRHYFKDDKSESPLVGINDDSSRLVGAVAGYMKAADGELLYGLFYQPDVGAWQNLYRQATGGKAFSILDLIALLDTTKTSIFDVYRAQDRPDTEAYFYIPTLFDNAMQQIFAGCWGISDEPVEDHVMRGLKEVYGRVISGVLTTTDSYGPLQDIVESLEAKKTGSSPTAQAHLAVLQECAASVLYGKINSQGGSDCSIEDFFGEFQQRTGVQLSQPSFGLTLEHVHYQNPLAGILLEDDTFRRIASGILNPLDEEALKERDSQYAMFDLMCSSDSAPTVEQIEADLVGKTPGEKYGYLQKVFVESEAPGKQISEVAFDIVSGLDPATQIDDVFGWVGEISGNFGQDFSGKTLSFTPAEQDRLLSMFEQSLGALIESEPGRILGELDRLLSRPSIFSLEKILAKTAAACRLVKSKHPAELGRVQHFLSRHTDKWSTADQATQLLVARISIERQ